MANLKGIRLGSSTLLLLALSSTAQGQNSGRTIDSAGVRGRAAAADTLNGHNWFVSLLRKIARKSDEDAALVADTTSMNSGGSGADNSVASQVTAIEAPATAKSFKSKKDSLAWDKARENAEESKGYRIVVDLFGKTLRVIDRDDTLRTATVATAKNETLEFGGKTWNFITPRGVRTVL